MPLGLSPLVTIHKKILFPAQDHLQSKYFKGVTSNFVFFLSSTMPRRKQQKEKRLTRIERKAQQIKRIVTEHAELMGKHKYMPDNHYLTISTSGPRQLTVTTIHKYFYQNHTVLSKYSHKETHEVTMDLDSWDNVLKHGFTYTIDY